MNFSEKAEEMRMLQIRMTENYPDETRNRICLAVSCFTNKDDVLEPVSGAHLVYQTLDPESEDSDSQLVRAGIWKKHECGTLSLESEFLNLKLARVNPKEQVDLHLGWITEKGEVILRR